MAAPGDLPPLPPPSDDEDATESSDMEDEDGDHPDDEWLCPDEEREAMECDTVRCKVEAASMGGTVAL